MSFTQTEMTVILSLKSAIASHYSLQMKKIANGTLDSLFYSNCIIAGGMIQSLFHRETVNDIDLYAKGEKSMKEIKTYILNLPPDFIKTSKKYNLDMPEQRLVTDNAVTLVNDVQFVYLNVFEACRQKFDFVHCMPYYDLMTQKLHISKTQFDAIVTKTLICNVKGEAIKEHRIKKYIDKGWKLSPDVLPERYLQK